MTTYHEIMKSAKGGNMAKIRAIAKALVTYNNKKQTGADNLVEHIKHLRQRSSARVSLAYRA